MNNFQLYFKDWVKVLDYDIINDIMGKLKPLYATGKITPAYKDIFKVFNITPYNKLKVIFLGQDPYPQKDVATGIAFANKPEVKELSPSLNLLKESVIDFEVPHNIIIFDQTLEEWSKQGILLLNTALTVELNKPGSHALLWRPFIHSLLSNLTISNPGLIYVLFGNDAQSFESDIKNNIIIKERHPSWYCRNHQKLPHSFFVSLDKKIKEQFNEEITWFNELK